MISYLKNECPHCGKDRIFRGIYRMNAACPSCGEAFERESGYFIGAMIASYFLGVFLVFPVLLGAVFVHRMATESALLLSVAMLLALQPLLFRYSRILWIRLEARLTRSIHPPTSGKE